MHYLKLQNTNIC
ncbi:hypothetical protein Zm00014a_038808 [Zea mays]|uniref:Uncharacterized protein n=1 Tax=Zea mays TaxID=4577 RepID=A0A3L6E357_MAIZE|nr:hypothetical protein Zm00014a_038808 [Zea mays]